MSLGQGLESKTYPGNKKNIAPKATFDKLKIWSAENVTSWKFDKLKFLQVENLILGTFDLLKNQLVENSTSWKFD